MIVGKMPGFRRWLHVACVGIMSLWFAGLGAMAEK